MRDCCIWREQIKEKIEIMKKFQKMDVSFKELYGLLYAPIKFKLLMTGIELKIFNHLSEQKSAETVAEAIGGHPGNTALFLDGLTAMGLVKKNDGLYQNMPIPQTFLVEDGPTYLGKAFANQVASRPDTLNDLPLLVREGPPAPSKTYTASDEMTEEDVLSYVPIGRAGRVHMVAGVASELPEFPSFQKMLDLGCGPGLNGIAIVDAHPSMKGVVFDRPKTIKIAENVIKEYGMQDRIEMLSGNYAQDSIGEGYDLILVSDTLYYNQDEMALIMKKIYNALNPGGVLISLHVGTTHERTQPADLVMSVMLYAMTGEDMGLMEQGVIADHMVRAGFKSVHSRTLDTDWGPLDLDIGRK
jgi:predicted O-methyltransferase YrrM